VTLQKDHIKFQINQLTWTLTIIILTVGQLKYIMHNLFNGMIWFCLPVLLVVVNDIMAYVCGMTCGKKFINRPFLKLSPNKTWEGFIGGGICTIIIGWYLAKLLAQFNWMICPAPITLWSDALTCEPDPLYVNGHLEIPEQVFELLPVSVGRWIPGITEFCRTAKSSSADVAACVSGAKPYLHHHFELSFPVLPIQVHAIPLAIFASVVAPFGGFLASGIKRAYDIKDFDNTIPGHGGIMDRMDCQFLMALCTWVHYNAFVRMTTVSVAKLLFLFKLLPDGEQAEFVKEIAKFAAQ
jgi:phosphatidate cytidylyltransferase